MANPVAIYSPAPAAPSARGGSGSAQVIQIDLYRSGDGARFSDVNPAAGDAASASAAYAQPLRNARRGGSSFAGDTSFEAGRRRAPASLSFAAQQIAQEGLSPGLHFEDYKPAIAAYVAAAAGPSVVPPGRTLEMVA